MFRLPFARRGEKIAAVAEVGSDSVGVCVAKLEKSGVPRILAAEKAVLRFEERTAKQTVSGILTLLQEVCEKLVSKYARLRSGNDETTPHSKRSRFLIGAEPISSAVAVIKTPWTDSRISRVATKFDKEERITGDIVHELAKQALEAEKDKSLFFEASVVRIELNGYPTKKPAGKHAHTVEVASLLSQCEPIVRDRVSEILQKSFPGASVSIRSGTRSILSLFHDSAGAHDHLVVDISGDSANCIAIRGDIAAEHLAATTGVRTILKQITGDGMAEEKLSLLRMVLRDACSGAACDQFKDSLSKVEQDLVRVFGETFGELASARKLPNDLVLIATPDFAPWLSKFFSRIDFSQFTASTRPFAPRAIAQNEIQELVSPAPGVSVEPGLAIAARFVNSDPQ